MNLKAISAHLPEERAQRLAGAVAKLEAAIAAGMVPNVLFVDAKGVFNWAVESAANAFLESGPHLKGRNGEPHHMSDWWLDAYDHDAFVSGASNIPSALKRSEKNGMKEYAAFLAALLPLQQMLVAAKPLIKKKGELPKVKSEKQIAEEGERMHCQCCGRAILAKLGSIAHHGYERPGYGWQSASCMGAKELPFEVDRKVLGRMIEALKDWQKRMKAARAKVAAEQVPIKQEREIGFGAKREKKSFEFSRANFASEAGQKAKSEFGIYYDFDEMLKRELASRDSQLRGIASDIKMQQARYDGWKQSHRWNKEEKEWVAL